MDLTGIEINRWEKGIEHDPRSTAIMQGLTVVDYSIFANYFDWRTGGDGDNGETLMYELDIYFELKDKGRL